MVDAEGGCLARGVYRMGQPELDALERVIRRGQPFRYFEPSECAAFEREFAEYLGVEHAVMCASGTAALVACLVGLGIGPGDEVIVPAITYLATATAVLAVGAIPVIVDVDESLTLDPAAVEREIGPHTRALIPVHMWGQAADMDALCEIARRRGLLVVEDVCQAVGGGAPGRRLGSFGDAAAFSFNYYKNISAGEGGAAVTRDATRFERMRCQIDCCGFFWNGHSETTRGFASNSSRASEFEGALLRVQLGRLPEMIDSMREHKRWVAARVAHRLELVPERSEDSAGTHLVLRFDSAESAQRFAAETGATVVSETGRHLYTRWTPVLERRGAHHPALDPFLLPANARCRRNYALDQCKRSIRIAERSVLIAMHPDHSEGELDALVERLLSAARSAA
jgi:dTDP-4-amino-4,6-dideoxygalactose transaminase